MFIGTHLYVQQTCKFVLLKKEESKDTLDPLFSKGGVVVVEPLVMNVKIIASEIILPLT